MPRLQDLPDISSKVTDKDKLVIVRTDSQGLATIETLKQFVDFRDDNNEGGNS